MSDNFKYDQKTLMSLLKLVLAVRTDLTKEEKESVIKLAEQIILKGKNKDYEDNQIFTIKDYKRRN
jgi:hypothetical protein